MSEEEEELDFEAAMSLAGVRAYVPPSEEASADRPSTPAPPSRPAPPEPTAEPPRPEQAHPLESDVRKLEVEREHLLEQLQGLQERVGELEAELSKARSERDGIDRRRQQLEEERGGLESRLAEATAATELRTLLAETGCRDGAEEFEALSALLAAKPEELLQGLVLASVEGLGRLLHEDLSFLCDAEACQPQGPCAVVRVPPERCEVCGGSDLKASWKGLLSACEIAGVSELVVVGGSPPYRTRLKTLHSEAGGALGLELVSGSRSRSRRRAEADLRRADVVVLWGGSILDHSTSDQYRRATCPVLTIPHRGLTGMLDALSARLRQGL